MREALERVQAEVFSFADIPSIVNFLSSLPSPYLIAEELKSILPWTHTLRPPALHPQEARTGLSLARLGVKTTGTLLVPGTDTASLLPETSVILLPKERIVDALDDLVLYVAQHAREHLVAISGPSRTADIEKTLVLGAHGPERLIVLLLDQYP
ncbi:MAG TPA: LUD domain-containing protein [Thermoanaerobaculia bacterium]|nr:LUD domain-containing protein [Thermoanaerobaculia bacterium]HUM30535.1 LUD domain-containing protein [Thermoanaerobaculia bacterium]HXK68727.1 LUD domain-containing protein [Thermoanaerobaculia bacterium]